LAALEKGKHAFCFSSGLGTLTAITGLLKAGDHLIVGDDLYGGTNSHIRKCSSRQGMTYNFVDITDIQNIIDAIQPNTKVNKETKNITEFNLHVYLVLEYFVF